MPKRILHKNYPVIPYNCLLVYTLRYKNTNEIFYIGSTGNPVARMSAHYIKFGREITMEVLEIIECKDDCYIGFAFDTERFWITMFLSWGFNLKNKSYTRNTMQGKWRNTLNKKAA